MVRRTLVSVSAFIALTAIVALVATVPASGQAPSAAKTNGAGAKAAYTPAKTPDGQPDLSGYWTNASYTPLQRPKGVEKEFYTPAELEELAAAVLRENARDTGTGTPRDLHYDNDAVRDRQGPGHVRAEPADIAHRGSPGRQDTAQIPEAVKRNAAIAEARKRRGGQFDRVQNMGYDDRCIVMIGTAPPMLDPGYLSTFQIIQSPGYVTILTERLHDARVIPVDGRPFPPSNVRSWKGVSRGHWEGNTLVVETRNSNGRIQEAAVGPIGNGAFEGATENIRVIERFTRVDAATIGYRFTIEDEKTWARPWSAELPFARMEQQGPFFEHACHEGNRAPTNMMSVVRHQEKLAAEAAAKKTSN